MTHIAVRQLPLFALAVACFAINANLRMMDALLPAISGEFGVSIAEAAQVITLFSLGYGLSLPVFGVLADRIGKLRMILFLCAACVVTSLGCAMAYSLGWLSAARFLAGMSASGIVPVSMALIGDSVAPADRGAALARYMSGGVLGSVLGQIAGGLAADTIGWRAAPFGLCLLFILACIALVRHIAADDQATPARRPVSPGAVLAGAARSPDARNTLLLVAAEGAVIYGTLAYIAADLQQRLGLNATGAGLCLACFAIGSLIYLRGGPHILRRLALPRLLPAGGAIYLVSMLLLGLTTVPVLAALGVAGAGFAFACLHNYLQTRGTQISAEARGTGMALFASCYFFGQAGGVWLVAVLLPVVDLKILFMTGGVVILAIALRLGRLSVQP